MKKPEKKNKKYEHFTYFFAVFRNRRYKTYSTIHISVDNRVFNLIEDPIEKEKVIRDSIIIESRFKIFNFKNKDWELLFYYDHSPNVVELGKTVKSATPKHPKVFKNIIPIENEY